MRFFTFAETEPLPGRTIALALLLFLPVPLLFLFFGIDGIQSEVRFRKHTKALETWKSVSGRILKSKLLREWQSRKSDGFVAFSFETRYEYAVNSKKFTGTRVFFQVEDYSFLPRTKHVVRFGHKSEDAEQMQKKFKEGTTCTVYFDSLNPENSVLQREFSENSWFLVAGYFFIVFFGVMGLIWCLAFAQTGMFPRLPFFPLGCAIPFP